MTSKAEYESIVHECEKASKALTRAWNNLDHFNLSTTDRSIAQTINEAQGGILRTRMRALGATQPLRAS